MCCCLKRDSAPGDKKGLRDELPGGEKQDPTEEFSLIHMKCDLNVSTSRKTGDRGRWTVWVEVLRNVKPESKKCKAGGKDRWEDCLR